MKTQMVFSLACSISLFSAAIGSCARPALAQFVQPAESLSVEQPAGQMPEQPIVQPTLQPAVTPANTPSIPPFTERQPVTIPVSTAIIVSFPAEVAVDVGQHQDYPLTLPLAQPIYDEMGNLLIPENTPVSVLLKPVDRGAQIEAQSIVVNGQIVPLQASSPMIPGATITHVRGNDKAMENGAVFGRLVGSSFGFLNSGDPDQFDRGAMLGSAIGLLSGLRSPENTRVVQIPQGSVYVLQLQAPVVLQLQAPVNVLAR